VRQIVGTNGGGERLDGRMMMMDLSSQAAHPVADLLTGARPRADDDADFLRFGRVAGRHGVVMVSDRIRHAFVDAGLRTVLLSLVILPPRSASGQCAGGGAQRADEREQYDSLGAPDRFSSQRWNA